MAIPSFSVIVTAAGSSTRFKDENINGSVKKEFMSVDGHSVLYSAASKFMTIPGMVALAITFDSDVEVQTKYALEDLVLQHDIPILMVEGGKTRQNSVFNALRSLSDNGLGGQFVMIHDGARPFVSLENIYQIFAEASLAGAAAGAIPISDAVIEITDRMTVSRHVDKKRLMLIQTPQIFRFDQILEAHAKAGNDDFEYGDDASIYQKYIGDVSICPGDECNRKITWPHDLEGM